MRASTIFSAATMIALAALLFAAYASGSGMKAGNGSGKIASPGQYRLASIDDCIAFDYTSSDYNPADRSSGFTGDNHLAKLAYQSGQGAFSSDNFPPSTRGGSVFYGFASAQAAQAMLLKFWKDGHQGITPVWRVGNIIVENLPVKLPSVEANVLIGCFHGTLNRVMLPPSYVNLGKANMNVRAAIPAIEAYASDNNSYAGVTVAKIRRMYDRGISGVTLVHVTSTSFCLQSVVSGQAVHVNATQAMLDSTGPLILPGRCR